MKKILEFFKHRYFKFGLYSLMYLLWVIWLGNYWWLPGLAVIFDMYITQKVNWSPWKKREGKNSTVVEWFDALLFAVIAVSVINIFLFQNYKIPTPSMEKSLLIGDHLYVSKVAYGPRLPNTPLAFPFAQHTLPGTKKTKSYVTWIQKPYKRLKGLREIQRDDVVVFNFPEGDTAVVQNMAESYYLQQIRLGEQLRQNDLVQGRPEKSKDEYINQARKYLWAKYDIVAHPVDRTDNYIKRCVGVAGDTIEVIHKELFVNGKPQMKRDEVQYRYIIITSQPFSKKALRKIGIASNDIQAHYENQYYILLNNETYAKIKNFNNIISIQPYEDLPGEFDISAYPHHPKFPWNLDNYGPLYIPKAGDKIELTEGNIIKYEKIISHYEKNDFKVIDSVPHIDGAPVTHYTFKMDYFWMMGDNRHASADSRIWGFVPMDHIVGRPVFIWLSKDADESFPKNIRLKRMFKQIK